VKVLCASLATPGLLFPVVEVATELARRGHNVDFATGLDFTGYLHERGFYRVPRTANDGPSFGIDGWGRPEKIVMQVKHLRYAIERSRPDAIVCSNLALGPLIAKELYDVPVGVLGSVVYLWPTQNQFNRGANGDAFVTRLIWRFNEMKAALEEARVACGLTPNDFTPENSPLLGDAFFVQGVEELCRESGDLPDRVTFVGSCLHNLDDPSTGSELVDWITSWRARGASIAYIQVGRSFTHTSFWPFFLEFSRQNLIASIVSIERYDAPVGDASPNVFIRDRLSQHAVLPHCDFVLCSGHPTAVLGAVSFGLPMIIAYTGSGTDDIGETLSAYGAAIAFSESGSSIESLRSAIDAIATQPSFRERAQDLQGLFARKTGPAKVADALEALVPSLGHQAAIPSVL